MGDFSLGFVLRMRKPGLYLSKQKTKFFTSTGRVGRNNMVSDKGFLETVV